MKKIPLSQGQFALVSNKWYKRLMTRYELENCQTTVKWCSRWSPFTKSFCAQRTIYLLNGKKITEQMHRRILGLQHGDRRPTDHINHDTLNNLPTNLRVVTTRGNAENRWNQSKYGVGISYDSRLKSRPFNARAQIDGRTHHIGMFVTAKVARAARKAWLIKMEVN